MREKTVCVVVTFHTTAEAMATERVCREREIAGKLFSAPRSLSADCGIAWRGAPDTRTVLSDALKAENIEYAGFHEMEL